MGAADRGAAGLHGRAAILAGCAGGGYAARRGQIFIFDVSTDPGNPKLVKTIDDFVEKSGGVVGPHGAYALPGG